MEMMEEGMEGPLAGEIEMAMNSPGKGGGTVGERKRANACETARLPHPLSTLSNDRGS